MSLFARLHTRVLGAAMPAMIVGATLVLAQAPAASADTAPPDPTVPATVSADALPAPQIDGVVWAQAIVGNTVYAGGNFANARPAGSAPGANQVPRSDLLSYDLTTGNLNSWAPVLNGQVLALAGSPDGSRLYVGGDFTSADGINKYRILAYNTATGKLDNTFSPTMDYRVSSIVATASTVFVGGAFKTVNGQTRTDVAAFQASNGALLSWDPVLDGQVKTMVLTPDGSRLIVGGEMQNINSVAAYGMGSIDVATGATEPWAVNKTIMDSGSSGGITTLSTDGSYIYGGGYDFGSGANFEGTFQADPMTGNIIQIEDCHGDTYSTYEMGAVLYEVGHSHMCNNIGGFPETPTRTWHRTLAFAYKQTPTCTEQHNTIGNYVDWYGYSCASWLDWFPTLVSGTFTGQDQAAWSVTGNGQYLVEGGEFPSVNGIPQQGLVRFAISSIAPNKMGPVNTGANFVPQVTSQTPGTVKITFPTDWDQDNTALTYQIVRNSNKAAPIYTTTVNSTFWQNSRISFTDTGLTPGQTYKYRVYATDPFGNQAVGDNVNVTVASTGPSSYATTVLGDGAATYYRLDEPSGPTAYDWAGYENGILGTGVTQGTPGAIGGDTDTAMTFDGAADGTLVYPDQIQAPTTFSLEAWINTTTTTGGKIIGFGTAQTGNSLSYDRQIYMDNAGHLIFGVYTTKTNTLISSGTYNDGKPHHLVATLGSGGIAFYVDGQQVGTAPSPTSAQLLNGWWRVGGDSLGGSWPNLPTSTYFKGTIDDVAVYPTALTASQIANHYAVAVGQPVPVASFVSTTNGLAASFDASSSTDANGSIASFAWDFGDGTTGTGVTAQHTYASAGTYTVALRVTDNHGSTATTTTTLVVSTPVTTSPPAFLADTPPTSAAVGDAYSYTFAASGSPAPTFSVNTGTLPDGLTLTSAGVLAGTPTSAATYTFGVLASNSAGTATAGPFRLTVTAAITVPVVNPPAPPPPAATGGGGSGGGGGVVTGVTPPVSRLAGNDRFATAAAVSQEQFADAAAAAVVLASGDNYPDALVGGPLAAAKHAPLLLTSGNTLPDVTKSEIERVLTPGATVYVLGGATAIPASVDAQLSGMGYHVSRYAGSNRFATAVLVANALGNPATVLLASGSNYPDALSAGVAAGHIGGVVLLTNDAALPAETAAYLDAHATTTFAIGGPASRADAAAVSVAGGDRFATAVAVAKRFFADPTGVGFATASGFADALSGGPLLVVKDQPLLLVGQHDLPPVVAAYLANVAETATHVYLFGGNASIDATVAGAVAAASAPVGA